MGNRNGKETVKFLLTVDELEVLKDSYKAVASFKVDGHFSDDKLMKQVKSNLYKAWSKLLDPHLAQCTSNYLLKTNSSSISLNRFAEPYYIVEHGTTGEKAKFLTACLRKTSVTNFAKAELENYVASVLRSYLIIQNHLNTDNYKSWKKNGYQSTERTVVSFVRNLTRSLEVDGELRLDLNNLERWFDQNPIFLTLWRNVFTNLYSLNAGKHVKLGSELTPIVIPLMEGLKTGTNYTPILDMHHVIFLNNSLPNELRSKWRLLFSSKIMGESFTSFLARITQMGPTIIIVEDEDSYIFAGYAPASWSISPLFVGDDTSMLFTLSPSMRCFSATGYNNHYQYLNFNQQTMPNGLGMGGQFDYWGLWIDSEYGRGQSSESCTTYRSYVQLSKRNDFRISNLEVFGVGNEPATDEYNVGSHQSVSVLDRHLEARAILELSGTEMHSDGLRQPDMDS